MLILFFRKDVSFVRYSEAVIIRQIEISIFLQFLRHRGEILDGTQIVINNDEVQKAFANTLPQTIIVFGLQKSKILQTVYASQNSAC